MTARLQVMWALLFWPTAAAWTLLLDQWSLSFRHFCLAELTRKQELRKIEENIYFHQATGLYQCGVCFKTYKSKDSARNHFEGTHCNNSYRCDYCPKTFKNQSRKRYHVHYSHREEAKIKGAERFHVIWILHYCNDLHLKHLTNICWRVSNKIWITLRNIRIIWY